VKQAVEFEVLTQEEAPVEQAKQVEFTVKNPVDVQEDEHEEEVEAQAAQEV